MSQANPQKNSSIEKVWLDNALRGMLQEWADSQHPPDNLWLLVKEKIGRGRLSDAPSVTEFMGRMIR